MMEQPIYNDGPDYPDGTDAEGFPGGDQRFGIIKPSKEEVALTMSKLSGQEVNKLEAENPALRERLCEQ